MWVSSICSGVFFLFCCVVMDKMFARFELRKSLKKMIMLMYMMMMLNVVMIEIILSMLMLIVMVRSIFVVNN